MCDLSPRDNGDVPVITYVLHGVDEVCYGVYVRGVYVVSDGYCLMSKYTGPPCKFGWQELTVTQEAVGVKIYPLSNFRPSMKSLQSVPGGSQQFSPP
ncbi:MAG: hypothetical protein Kow0021_12590 [Methanothermobacter thermautotrophicus]